MRQALPALQRTTEQVERDRASMFALQFRGAQGGPFTLVEKYDAQRTIGGPYHFIAALERGISRYRNKLAQSLAEERVSDDREKTPADCGPAAFTKAYAYRAAR